MFKLLRGKFKSLDRIEKIHFALSLIIIFLVIVAIVLSAWRQQWWSLFISIGALIMAFTPTIFEWRTNIEIPEEFEFIILFFIFTAIILGEVQGFYAEIWWLDIALHLSAGIALGIMGFTIFYVFYIRDNIQIKPIFIALFSFTFSLSIGVLWEIFEFTMDQLFALNMQKSGLLDTMKDLIVDSIGAFTAAFFGYLYMKGKKPKIFYRLLTKFREKNPQLFKKKVV